MVTNLVLSTLDGAPPRIYIGVEKFRREEKCRAQIPIW